MTLVQWILQANIGITWSLKNRKQDIGNLGQLNTENQKNLLTCVIRIPELQLLEISPKERVHFKSFSTFYQKVELEGRKKTWCRNPGNSVDWSLLFNRSFLRKELIKCTCTKMITWLLSAHTDKLRTIKSEMQQSGGLIVSCKECLCFT